MLISGWLAGDNYFVKPASHSQEHLMNINNIKPQSHLTVQQGIFFLVYNKFNTKSLYKKSHRLIALYVHGAGAGAGAGARMGKGADHS
jgi:CRISPR/Cas system CMR subunit Cmr6 (Cas7 group RAMP superfamily)